MSAIASVPATVQTSSTSAFVFTIYRLLERIDCIPASVLITMYASTFIEDDKPEHKWLQLAENERFSKILAQLPLFAPIFALSHQSHSTFDEWVDKQNCDLATNVYDLPIVSGAPLNVTTTENTLGDLADLFSPCFPFIHGKPIAQVDATAWLPKEHGTCLFVFPIAVIRDERRTVTTYYAKVTVSTERTELFLPLPGFWSYSIKVPKEGEATYSLTFQSLPKNDQETERPATSYSFRWKPDDWLTLT